MSAQKARLLPRCQEYSLRAMLHPENGSVGQTPEIKDIETEAEQDNVKLEA